MTRGRAKDFLLKVWGEAVEKDPRFLEVPPNHFTIDAIVAACEEETKPLKAALAQIRNEAAIRPEDVSRTRHEAATRKLAWILHLAEQALAGQPAVGSKGTGHEKTPVSR